MAAKLRMVDQRFKTLVDPLFFAALEAHNCSTSLVRLEQFLTEMRHVVWMVKKLYYTLDYSGSAKSAL